MQTREKTDFPFKKSKIVTDLQNHELFMWIYNRIHKKAEKLQFFRRHSSLLVRSIKQAKKKSGRKPSLFVENCLFLTFIRLRVGLTETDLVFRFQVSVPNLKNTCHMDIFSLQRTFTFNLLEDVLWYYPKCFTGLHRMHFRKTKHCQGSVTNLLCI